MPPLREMTADELEARMASIRELNPSTYEDLQSYRNTAAQLRRVTEKEATMESTTFTPEARAAELLAEARQPLNLRLMVPEAINPELAAVVDDIAEEALQAFYTVVCRRITETVGGPTSGDLFPGECMTVESAARRMVLAHALNNENAYEEVDDTDN